VNIGDFLAGIDTTDLLVVLFLFAMFILGFVQGTIRRLLGIGGMVFSFLLAANVKGPLGDFLGANWTQFPPEYAAMIGFLTVFVAALVAFTLTIQGTYHRTALFEKYTFVDEVIGGFLGVVQAMLLLIFLKVILDSYFLLPFPVDPQEIEFLRTSWTLLHESGTGDLLNGTIIPRLLAIGGLLVPESIKALYPRA